MTAAAATPQTQQVWLALSLAAATAVWLAAKPVTEAASMLPWILCSTSNSQPARPRSVVKTLRSEPLVTAAGKYVTMQLVHLPPMAFSPRHVHGGDVTAYVLKGTVRSEHSGLPAAAYHEGDVFHEPYGTTHVFLENPSATESADILAITVHDKGAPLTTFLD